MAGCQDRTDPTREASVVARSGSDVLLRLGHRLDVLHATAQVPITARRTWLQAWIDAYRDFDVLAISLEDPTAVDAAALLAWRRRRGIRQVVACGHGPSDVVALPSRNAVSAGRLAQELTEHLRQSRGPWRLALRHVTAEDAVIPLLAERLARSHRVPGDRSPILRAESGTVLNDYVTSSHRRGVAGIRNRLVKSGLRPRIEHLSDVTKIDPLLPDMERIYRRRDEAVGRRCALDVPSHLNFFRLVTRRHAVRCEVVLTTVHLDDKLAAYALCFEDGGALRMWNCRFDPQWARYSPGKLAVEESVAHALTSGFTAYDFMRGVERYKLSYANDEARTQDFRAASGVVLSAAEVALVRAREQMIRLEASEGRGAVVVSASRRFRDRWLHQ